MNYLIHSTGRNWVKRKPIARLFEPIKTGDSQRDGITGNILYGHQSERFKGTFAERNAKREKEKCEDIKLRHDAHADQKRGDHAATAISHAVADAGFLPRASDALEKQPEFKVGDLVECLPDSYMAIGPHEGIQKIFAIEGPNEIDPIVAACFDDVEIKGKWWPLRALRHAETEPSSDDGWIEVVCSDTLQLPNWLKHAIEAAKGVDR